MKVEDIRQRLVELGLSQEEADSIKGKSNLLEKLEELAEESEKIYNIENLDNLDDNETEELEFEFGSPEWNDYVMGLFYGNELHDGKYPNVNALRRLVQKLVGYIKFSGVTQVFAPTSQDGVGRATVVYNVRVITDYGEVEYSDVADCWHGNSNPIFAVHPSAMASSRAEGRCLRKILGLTVNTFEEMDNPNNPVEMVESSLSNKDIDDFESQSITSMQKSVLTNKTQSMKIDIYKFINENFKGKYVSLEQMNREDAQVLIKLINSYQSGTDIPQEILA